MSMTEVRISGRPRIHIALADLGHLTARAYGGIGFAFDGPPNVWSVRKAREVRFTALDEIDAPARKDFADLADRIVALRPGVGFEATLIATAPQHAGYGSKTSLLLGLATAVDALFDLGMSPDELRRVSGRGGASGTGSHSFFEGGVIWDGGHPQDPNRSFGPSSAGRPADPPPKIARWDFPDDWRIATFIPRDPQFSGAVELEFFRSNTPLPHSEVAQTIGALYHAVAPGFALADIELLRAGLHILHTTGFKRRSLLRRSMDTRSFISRVSEGLRLPVGVSSIGPMIYVIFRDAEAEIPGLIRQAGDEFDIPFAGIYRGYNRGYELSNE